MIDLTYKLIEKIFKIEKHDLIRLIKESAVILLIAAVAGFLVNMYHPRGYTFVSASMFESKQIVSISSEEAKAKIDSGLAVLLDTRTASEFNESHIPGAIHIPAMPESIALQKIEENFGLLKSQKEIILYCDGASCGSSPILAQRLISMGYKKILHIIEHGIPEWIEKGYPVDAAGRGE